MHRAAALAIEGAQGAERAANYAQLAAHWELAAEPAKGAAYRLRAADRALGIYAHHEALAQLRAIERAGGHEDLLPAKADQAEFAQIWGRAAQELTDFELARPWLLRCAALRGVRVRQGRPALIGGVAREVLTQILLRSRFLRPGPPGEAAERDALAALLHNRFAEHAYFDGDLLSLLHDTLVALNCAELGDNLRDLIIATGARGVNFESHWCAEPPVEHLTLTRGKDFDDVVLALPLGCYKPLNSDPGMCDALIARGGRFADFVHNVRVVPTYSVQLWVDLDESALGWTKITPATVAGPQPLCVWADMSQVLAVETPSPDRNAKTLQYFCGTYPTELYAQPEAATDTPVRAAVEIRKLTVEWLKADARWSWPAVSNGRSFKWDVLCAPAGVTGDKRLDAQFLRANIDPTECTVGSDAGTTKYRLGPADAGFDGLYLAGEELWHGFNATAVESAVMSGLAAANAIASLNLNIIGYDLPTRKPSDFLR